MQDSLLDSTVTLCDFDDAFTPYLAVFVQNKHGEREQCTQRNMQGTVSAEHSGIGRAIVISIAHINVLSVCAIAFCLA